MKSVLRLGDRYRMSVEGFADYGETFGEILGVKVYLPLAIPGEHVEVQITEIKTNFARAKLLRVLTAAKARVKAPCSYFDTCGGCQWQHIDYTQQLLIKRKMVKDVLNQELGSHSICIKDVLPSPHVYYYRNKALQPVVISKGEPITGFYLPGTHRVLSIEECRIQPDQVNHVIQCVMSLLSEFELMPYDEKRHEGFLRHILVRMGFNTNQLMLVLVTRQKDFSEGKEFARILMREIPELISVIQNVNSEKTNAVLGSENHVLGGQLFIEEKIGHLRFKISPTSFFQINTDQALKICGTVLAQSGICEEDEVVDLYCGVGLIGLFLASKAKKVYGIENVVNSIENAKENADLNEIKNVEWICAQAHEGLNALKEKSVHPKLIVLDPPRQGCTKEVIQGIVDLHPSKIIYVSCEIKTLARDLKIFSSLGYQTKEIQPLDLFPHTYHVECVVTLERSEGNTID